ncbi:MAG TPA: regulatory protein RecX [bacterium]|nr:regulatory protein RecX [bacterium]
MTSTSLEQELRDKAYAYLARRSQSEAELRRKLSIAAGAVQQPEETVAAVIDAVITSLKAKKYLDDRAFSDDWVASRIAHKPRGSLLLRAELRAKGVDASVINEVLEARLPPEAEKKLASQQIRKKDPKNTLSAIKKHRYLENKGYPYEVIRAVIHTDDTGD